MRHFTPPTTSKRLSKKKKESAAASDRSSAATPEVESMMLNEVIRVKPKKDKATNVRYRQSHNYHRLIVETKEAAELLNTLEMGTL